MYLLQSKKEQVTCTQEVLILNNSISIVLIQIRLINLLRGLGGGGSSFLYISIAYYMQKGGGWVQIACKNAYVLNGRPLMEMVTNKIRVLESVNL